MECILGRSIPKSNSKYKCILHQRPNAVTVRDLETLFTHRFLFFKPPRRLLEDAFILRSYSFAREDELPNAWISLRNASQLEFSRGGLAVDDLLDGSEHLSLSYGRESLVVAVASLYPGAVLEDRGGYELKTLFIQRFWRNKNLSSRLVAFAKRRTVALLGTFLVVDLLAEPLAKSLPSGLDVTEGNLEWRYWLPDDS